jgi:hypothetical protein
MFRDAGHNSLSKLISNKSLRQVYAGVLRERPPIGLSDECFANRNGCENTPEIESMQRKMKDFDGAGKVSTTWTIKPTLLRS